MKNKKLFDWFWKKEIKFSVDEVKDLVERIKAFNAGCIDKYLTEHTDVVFEKWLKDKKK